MQWSKCYPLKLGKLLKKGFKEFEITKSVRYGDITVLFDLFKQYGFIELLNGLIPRRGLPVGEVFASLAINHIIDRETLNKFSKWYQDTALEELTGNHPRETKLLQSWCGNEDLQVS
jgi:hypothetical protein